MSVRRQVAMGQTTYMAWTKPPQNLQICKKGVWRATRKTALYGPSEATLQGQFKSVSSGGKADFCSRFLARAIAALPQVVSVASSAERYSEGGPRRMAWRRAFFSAARRAF